MTLPTEQQPRGDMPQIDHHDQNACPRDAGHDGHITSASLQATTISPPRPRPVDISGLGTGPLFTSYHHDPVVPGGIDGGRSDVTSAVAGGSGEGSIRKRSAEADDNPGHASWGAILEELADSSWGVILEVLANPSWGVILEVLASPSWGPSGLNDLAAPSSSTPSSKKAKTGYDFDPNLPPPDEEEGPPPF